MKFYRNQEVDYFFVNQKKPHPYLQESIIFLSIFLMKLALSSTPESSRSFSSEK